MTVMRAAAQDPSLQSKRKLQPKLKINVLISPSPQFRIESTYGEEIALPENHNSRTRPRTTLIFAVSDCGITILVEKFRRSRPFDQSALRQGVNARGRVCFMHRC